MVAGDGWVIVSVPTILDELHQLFNDIGGPAGVAAILISVLALHQSRAAVQIAKKALEAQTLTRVNVRCGRSLIPDLVLVVIENVGGLPVTIQSAGLVFLPDAQISWAGQLHHPRELPHSDDFLLPSLPHVLEPRQVLTVPFGNEALMKAVAMNAELLNQPDFAFRVLDSTGRYFDSPKMSIARFGIDCPIQQSGNS